MRDARCVRDLQSTRDIAHWTLSFSFELRRVPFPGWQSSCRFESHLEILAFLRMADNGQFICSAIWVEADPGLVGILVFAEIYVEHVDKQIVWNSTGFP